MGDDPVKTAAVEAPLQGQRYRQRYCGPLLEISEMGLMEVGLLAPGCGSFNSILYCNICVPVEHTTSPHVCTL